MARTKEKIMMNGKEYFIRKSKFTANLSPLHVSDDMTGKMQGIPSISTACTANPICIARMKNGESVCSHCFAETTMKLKPSVRQAMESNFYLLTENILTDDQIPIFKNVQIVRIESFGDVYNETQVKNYLAIIRKNPKVRFGAWTKNAWLWNDVLDEQGKPSNLSLVYSSYKLNTQASASEYISKKGIIYFDHVFTVYDKETCAFYGKHFVNCGARDCSTCQKCYHKRKNEFCIREELK